MTTRAITFSNAPGRIRVNHETGVEIRTVRGEYGERNTYSIWVPNQRSIGTERVSGDHTLAEARRVATEIVGRMRLVIADAYEAAQNEKYVRQEVKVAKELEKELALDQLMQRASTSIVKSLDATVDVKQRLHDLLRGAGVNPRLVQGAREMTTQMVGRVVRVTTLEQAVIEAARELVYNHGREPDGQLAEAVRALDRATGTPDPTGALADMCSQLPSCRPGDGEHSASCEAGIYQAAQNGCVQETRTIESFRCTTHGMRGCPACGTQNRNHGVG